MKSFMLSCLLLFAYEEAQLGSPNPCKNIMLEVHAFQRKIAYWVENDFEN